MKDVKFINSFSFIYSARPGTPASNLSEINKVESKKRLMNFQTIAEKIKTNYKKSLIDKIQASGKFNQGFGTTEYLSAALLDMSWHSLTTAEIQDAKSFEANVLKEIGLIKEISPRYRTGYYSHIFSGGYSASYYGYIWSNIYDADTWLAFKEKGIFDQNTAELYRKHVLEPGGTEDPTIMYRRFRGQDPKVEPLLERRGLLKH